MLRRVPVAALLALSVGAAASAAEVASGEISQAERMVFLDEHLSRTRPPTVLRYSLEERAPEAPKPEAPAPGAPAPRRVPQLPAPTPGERLKLELKVRSDGGCCAVAAEDVGGQAFGYLPQLDDARSNPVILYFLERDIRQMSAATGGQANYFRKLIRVALADHATVRETTVRYGGRAVAAHEVRVAPYVDDPRRSLYEILSQKAYSFLLAPDVPGGVYQIRAATPAPATGAAPVAETVLTLAEATLAAAPAPSVQERTQ